MSLTANNSAGRDHLQTPHRWRHRQKLLTLLLMLAVACSAFVVVLGSEGDTGQAFRSCQQGCLRSGCAEVPGMVMTRACCTMCPQRAGQSPPPLALRLTRWDCAADCAYHCMWAVEGPKAAAHPPGPVYKYHGKWPFMRVLGAQELASVLFSLANLAAHTHNLWMYRRALRRLLCTPSAGKAGDSGAALDAAVDRYGGSSSGGYPYWWLWPLYSCVNMNAWLWSAVFHTRDTPVTERLDYFSADLLVATGVLVTLVRMGGVQRWGAAVAAAALVGLGLAQHIHYMAFVKFDYGYNMAVCIALGLAQGLAWLVWCARVAHPARHRMYWFLGLIHAAMLLEVLDFPPLLRLFDAHSLWHAATVPIVYLWYQWVLGDMAWVAGGSGGGYMQQAQQAGAAEGASPPRKRKQSD